MPQKRSLNELAKVIADHQASLSRLGEAWGQTVADALDDTDRQLIARLKSLIEDVQVNYRRNTAKAVDQLEYIRTKIEEIRARAFVKAEKALRKQAPELIDNENQWSKKLLSELTGEAKSAFSDITEAQAQKLLKNSIQINKTWDQWWTSTAYGDTMRIANVINSGIVQGLTIPQMTSLIMGTKAGNYEDGVLSTSRRHARNMARTLCAGISNQAKDQFYRDNQDIIPQVEWLDTLDGRTCPSCAGLSRQRYNTEDPHPVPPLHPQCRCVLIPVTELTDLGEDMPRSAANADFDAEAKRMYEEKYPQKRFEDLAASTREQYRHKAVHAYEERTGKPAYNRAPGSMRFTDYLQQSTEQFKKDWLGPGRYDLYKTGKYPIETFVPPYPNKAFTVKQVKEMDIESFRRSLAEGQNAQKQDLTTSPTEMYIEDALKKIDGKYDDLAQNLDSIESSNEYRVLEANAKEARDAMYDFDYYSDGGEKELRRLRKWVKETHAELQAFLEDAENETMAKLRKSHPMGVGNFSVYEPHKRLDPAAHKEYSEARKNIENTHRRFCRMFSDKYHINDLEVYANSTVDRSGYSPGNHHINLRVRQKTVYESDPFSAKSKYKDRWRADVGSQVHEMAHDMEWVNPHIQTRCREFLEYRTKGESPVSMNEVWLNDPTTLKAEKLMYPNGPYRADEMTKKDKFFSAYCGKEYASGSTEIFSMGVQRIVEDPVKFYKEDAEYFNFIVGLMRGDI